MLAFARPIYVRLYPLVRRARMVRVSKLAGSDSFALARCAVRLTARQHLPPAAEIVCGKPALRHPAGLMAGPDYHAVAHTTSTVSPTRTQPARRGASLTVPICFITRDYSDESHSF